MEQENQNVNETEITEKKDPLKNTVGKVVLALMAIVAFIVIMVKSTGTTGSECVIVPQAAFGQSQPQVWVELDSPATTKAIAEFEMDVPEIPVAYEQRAFRAYTKQIYEIRYYDAENNELLRIAKGKMCGNTIYDVNIDYPCRNTVSVDGLSVTEYGNDLETVAIAQWVGEDGEFSYFVGAFKDSLSKEDMENLVKGIK